MAVLVDTPVSAATIISRAMRLMGQLPSGGTPTTEEYADGLVTLNGLLDSFRNERLLCTATQDQPFSLVVGQEEYTIGPAANFATDRPVRIDGAYVVDSGGVSHDVEVVTDMDYARISLKTNPGPWPILLYYEASYPLGIVKVYPSPETTATLHLITWRPLTAFANTSDTMTLAPGWYDMLPYNLAVNLAPEFERDVLPGVAVRAKELKAMAKTINAINPVMQYDAALMQNSGYIDWRSGEAI